MFLFICLLHTRSMIVSLLYDALFQIAAPILYKISWILGGKRVLIALLGSECLKVTFKPVRAEVLFPSMWFEDFGPLD